MSRRRRLQPSDPAPGFPDGSGVTIERAIVAAVRAGTFPHVAAQAAGLDAVTYDLWMTPTKARGRYHAFRQAVLTAAAQARSRAEQSLFTETPETWLKSGPGKHTADSLGWTSPTKPPANMPQVQQAGVMDSNLLLLILAALSPFPEARAALAQKLAGSNGVLPISALPKLVSSSSEPEDNESR